MKSLSIIPKSLILLSISIYSSLSYADGDGGKIFKDWRQSKNPGVSAVKFQPYNETCGSCHFPYQPGLLPAVSWEKIMSNTDNHFGATLKLSAVESRTMTRYLLDNSAGH
ncbi:MAG: diheme cytochrome c, partial [Gammaproteobacteria bacterium]|nr:diheme cytochrome c [Gammaproteobacteria bacterium]